MWRPCANFAIKLRQKQLLIQKTNIGPGAHGHMSRQFSAIMTRSKAKFCRWVVIHHSQKIGESHQNKIPINKRSIEDGVPPGCVEHKIGQSASYNCDVSQCHRNLCVETYRHEVLWVQDKDSMWCIARSCEHSLWHPSIKEILKMEVEFIGVINIQLNLSQFKAI